MKSNYTTRQYQPSDLHNVHKLIVDTIDACYPAAYPPEAVDFFKKHHSLEKLRQAAAKDYIIVLEIDGQMVGTGTLEEEYITRVFVNPQCQGRGMGKAIMEALEAKAVEKRLKVVKIHASLPSLEFYWSRGYVTTEETYISVANNQRLDYQEMEKTL
jgi:N-acetylglutamate synthase-like GNAT family acetyltransferase